MTTHQQQSDMEAGTTDSLSSTPRSTATPRNQEDLQPRLRFMVSFGGQILPRPHDNQLRYVGGDTRIVAVNRTTTFSGLLNKLSKLSGNTEINIKYQLPNEDLDALISVSTDEDVENMMDEYERLIQGSNNPKLVRLRIFLFPIGSNSRSSSIGSLLDGSTKRENWFLDALNGGVGSVSLERGRSEVSSIVSEVPDYLFGLDNTDESKPRTRQILTDNVSVTDPGSPAPVTSSPYCSTSSAAPSMPNLPPVKTRLTGNSNPNPGSNPSPVSAVDFKETPIDGYREVSEPLIQQQQTGHPGNPVWHYIPESHYPGRPVQQMPVYYMPSPVPQQQVQQVHMQNQYVQRIQAPLGQIPVTYRHQVGPGGVGQMYGGGMRPVHPVEGYHEFHGGVVSDGQQMYYGGRNAQMLPTYGNTVVQGGPEMQGSGNETKSDGR